MPSIALATYLQHAYPTQSDIELIVPLTDAGFDVHAVAWDDPKADWSQYEAVIIRSTWDYHLRLAEFEAWLEAVNQVSRLFNPYDLVRWNLRKTYLQELAQAGAKTLPTLFFEDEPTQTLDEVIAAQGWAQTVIKPIISASADTTWRIRGNATDDDQQRFRDLVHTRGAMVQRYAPQIVEGEYSLVFFNGVYSHTAKKTPAMGEMLVQEELGGSLGIVEMQQAVIEQAKHIITLAQDMTGCLPLYARVDGILDGDDFVLMELECVEPELYFNRAKPHAAERFTNALVEAMNA